MTKIYCQCLWKSLFLCKFCLFSNWPWHCRTTFESYIISVNYVFYILHPILLDGRLKKKIRSHKTLTKYSIYLSYWNKHQITSPEILYLFSYIIVSIKFQKKWSKSSPVKSRHSGNYKSSTVSFFHRFTILLKTSIQHITILTKS